MKKSILALLLLLSGRAQSGTQIVAPEGDRVTIYVNADVGTTLKFQKDVKLITPRIYYVIQKQNSKYLYVTAKRGAAPEPVTIETGSDILYLNFVASRDAERFVKVLVTTPESNRTRRESLLEAIATGRAVTGVTREDLDGDPIEVIGARLKPMSLYTSIPYIGVVFERLDAPTDFDFRRLTIGPDDSELWSFEAGKHVTFIFSDRENLNVNALRTALREKKEVGQARRHHGGRH
jgi:hypothetical protein